MSSDKEEDTSVVSGKTTGCVKWFNNKQGYGFINDMRIKHKLDKKNIKIVNYKIHPSSEFFFMIQINIFIQIF